jgi:hypothetical protein
MRRFPISAGLIVVVTWVATASAEPVKSGPQPGQKVPGPFHPRHITGPDAGSQECLYCKNGANPVVMIFAREVSAPLISLLKQIDAVTAAHQDCKMGSFVVFLSDDPGLPATLKQIAEQEHVRTTILCTGTPAGPVKYQIAGDADVTVILYTHHTVKANYAFRKGELTESTAAAIPMDLGQILPSE